MGGIKTNIEQKEKEEKMMSKSILIVDDSATIRKLVSFTLKINNKGLLKENLDNVEKYFDYILIDVLPGSTLFMINGIIASENIIIPLDSGVFAYETIFQKCL